MSYETIRADRDGPLLTITLNHPMLARDAICDVLFDLFGSR